MMECLIDYVEMLVNGDQRTLSDCSLDGGVSKSQDGMDIRRGIEGYTYV